MHLSTKCCSPSVIPFLMPFTCSNAWLWHGLHWMFLSSLLPTIGIWTNTIQINKTLVEKGYAIERDTSSMSPFGEISPVRCRYSSRGMIKRFSNGDFEVRWNQDSKIEWNSLFLSLFLRCTMSDFELILWKHSWTLIHSDGASMFDQMDTAWRYDNPHISPLRYCWDTHDTFPTIVVEILWPVPPADECSRPQQTSDFSCVKLELWQYDDTSDLMSTAPDYLTIQNIFE
jgi:hypothetical protein